LFVKRPSIASLIQCKWRGACVTLGTLATSCDWPTVGLVEEVTGLYWSTLGEILYPPQSRQRLVCSGHPWEILQWPVIGRAGVEDGNGSACLKDQVSSL
jgi:hypothetical protein